MGKPMTKEELIVRFERDNPGHEPFPKPCWCGDSLMEVVRINGIAAGLRCPECGQVVAGNPFPELSAADPEEGAHG